MSAGPVKRQEIGITGTGMNHMKRGQAFGLSPSVIYKMASASVMCENMQQFLRVFQMQLMQDACPLVG